VLSPSVRGAGALPRAYLDGRDLDARRDMSYVSLVGGLALANARLGGVHGFAATLGGMFSAPHGALCAAQLAPVMKANIAALRRLAPERQVGLGHTGRRSGAAPPSGGTGPLLAERRP
jgi:alcohol dehydrogenase class IV